MSSTDPAGPVSVSVRIVEDGPRSIEVDMSCADWSVNIHQSLSERQVAFACSLLPVGGDGVLQAWRFAIGQEPALRTAT